MLGGREKEPGSIAIAINLPIIFAEIVNSGTNNHFYAFAPPPSLTKS